MDMIDTFPRAGKIGIIFFATAVGLWSMPALAQMGAQDRDPFFSSGPRSSAPVPPSPPREGDWGRDPFSHPFERRTEQQKGKDEPVPARVKILTGILFSTDVRIAIIGGEAVSEGGLVGDQKLEEIRMNSVVLINSAGIREELFLEEVPIRK